MQQQNDLLVLLDWPGCLTLDHGLRPRLLSPFSSALTLHTHTHAHGNSVKSSSLLLIETLLQKLSGHLVACHFGGEKGENKSVHRSSLPFDFLSPGPRWSCWDEIDLWTAFFSITPAGKYEVHTKFELIYIWAHPSALVISAPPLIHLLVCKQEGPRVGWVGMHSGADACAVRFLWAGGRI